jgi:hypothetical protein
MKDQQKYISFIVAFTILLFYLRDKLVNYLQIFWLANLLSSSATVLIIYLFYKLWESVLWKIRIVSKILSFFIGFNNYPVIEGKWVISYVSSFTTESDRQKRGKGRVTIKQDYSRVNLIDGKFGTSSDFESLYTTLQQKPNNRWFLIYLYENKPKDAKLINSKYGGSHKGFCYLEIINKNEMEGYYCNDEIRKTRGKVVFTRIHN